MVDASAAGCVHWWLSEARLRGEPVNHGFVWWDGEARVDEASRCKCYGWWFAGRLARNGWAQVDISPSAAPPGLEFSACSWP